LWRKNDTTPNNPNPPIQITDLAQPADQLVKVISVFDDFLPASTSTR